MKMNWQQKKYDFIVQSPNHSRLEIELLSFIKLIFMSYSAIEIESSQTADYSREGREQPERWTLNRSDYMIGNNGTTIDKTITYLLIGIFAIIFMAFTIVGMKNVQATAEQSKDGTPTAPKEVQLDISGEVK